MLKRLLRAVAIAMVTLLLVASPLMAIRNPDVFEILPVSAIVNPDAISFYCTGAVPIYRVFYDVMEAGDLLFVAEQYVNYAATPNETASEAFLFEVLNTSGNETIASVPLQAYEAQVISIYMDAAQVTSDNLSVGTAYIIRIVGNPLLFASETGNIVSATLNADDYVDQLLGVDDGVPTNNPLRNFLIGLADDLETCDSPPAGSEYLVTVSGFRYLSTTGGSIFLVGIPTLDVMCPILFQYVVTPMEGDAPETAGTYASALTPLQQWGSTVADGLTNFGLYLGINQALAGSLVLLMLIMGFAIYVYRQTTSGVAVLLLIGTTPYLGAWFGLMPIALAFVFTIIIIILMGFFFFSRGAL